LIASFVALALIMLSAVDFDDQSALTANKIYGVWANWFLAHELAAVDRTGAQPIPKAKLGAR